MNVEQSIQSEKKLPDLLQAARLLWLLPVALAIVVLIATIPATLEAAYQSSQTLGGYPAVSKLVGYPQYALSMLLLRNLAGLVFWLVGIFIYFTVGLRKSEFGGVGLYTALVLCIFPGPFILETLDATSRLPPVWDPWIAGANQFLTLLAVTSFVLFFYVFPDGRIAPRSLRWAAYIFVGGILIGLYLLFNIEADWTWIVMMLFFFSGMLVGLAGQVYRYRRLADRAQRRQTKWVIAALTALPLIFILGLLLDGAAWVRTIAVPAQIIFPALLPLSLVWAIQRRGLWEVSLSRTQKKWSWLSGAVIATIWIGGVGLSLQATRAEVAQSMPLQPLPASGETKPVVIDTDMDPNDWMAILYLLQRPEVEVLAITVSGTGETHCEPGMRNALGLVELSGGEDIPVACGRETPLQGDHVFPMDWREAADAPRGGNLPTGRNPSSGQTAPGLLVEAIGNASQKVTVVTLGPLTNLADAIQQDPSFLENVAEIYVMGGALEVLGNVGFSGVGIDNQVAEWNVYIDPLALEIVLTSSAPVTLVPLDATNHVPIDLDFYFQLGGDRRTPEANLAYDLLTGQLDLIASGGIFFWDPLTAALAVDESLGYIKTGKIWVSTASGTNSGLTRLLNQGYPARYAKWVDDEVFQADFLRTLNQP